MSEQGWREPETWAATGSQGSPREADPYAPPAEAPGPVYGAPPSYGQPPVPAQPPGYGPPSYPAAAPPAYGYPPYGYVPVLQRTSGMAVASLVLGLVWIYWIGSILAVIFGHIALNETKRDPRVGGRGLAIAGLVLGYIGLGIIAIIALVALVASVSPSST